MTTKHYSRTAAEQVASASTYSTHVAACGAQLNGYKVMVGAVLTDAAEETTCKRCLKALDSGSATSGWLAGTAQNRAEGGR